jgi:hypothetical protein
MRGLDSSGYGNLLLFAPSKWFFLFGLLPVAGVWSQDDICANRIDSVIDCAGSDCKTLA